MPAAARAATRQNDLRQLLGRRQPDRPASLRTLRRSIVGDAAHHGPLPAVRAPDARILRGAKWRSARRLAARAGARVQVRRPAPAGGATGALDVPPRPGSARRRRCRGSRTAAPRSSSEAGVQSSGRSRARSRATCVAITETTEARAAAGEPAGATAPREPEAGLRVELSMCAAGNDAPCLPGQDCCAD